MSGAVVKTEEGFMVISELKFNGKDVALKRMFLEAFASVGNISGACKKAGGAFVVQTGKYKGTHNPGRVYKWLNSNNQKHINNQSADPYFQDAFEQAREIYRDKVRTVFSERALNGWTEPVLGGRHRDEIIAYKHVYSDKLLITLATAVLPEFSKNVPASPNGVHVHLNQQFNNQGDTANLLDDLTPAEKKKLVELHQMRKERLAKKEATTIEG